MPIKTLYGYVYTGPVPNGSGQKIGSDRSSVNTRDRSGTGPERIQKDPKLDLPFYRSKFWIRFGPVPERSRVNKSRSGPVPCSRVARARKWAPARRRATFGDSGEIHVREYAESPKLETTRSQDPA